MAERKRSTRGGGGKRSAPKSRSASAKSRSASSRSRSARSSSARKAAARKGGRARGRQQRVRSQSRVEAKTVAELREALRKNLIRPLDMVMLTRERIEDVLADAVKQGQVTAKDASGIARGLVDRGRQQTNDVLKDLEQLMGKGRDEIEGRTGDARKRSTSAAKRARKEVRGAARGARSRAVKAADPALVQADRVRRAAGVGPNFPITAYDELTAAQVQGRLGDLTPAQLRKVRDHERRNANRKSVLDAIEKKLRR
jgi:polyhydroxyalkanoate synthesis regulator phasin